MTRAVWWRQATPGTSYWRCEIPARHLPGEVLELQYADAVPDERGEPSFPRQQGAAIWQFPGNRTRALMMMGHRQVGHRVIVEVDDNYLVMPPQIPGVSVGEWRLKSPKGEDPHSLQGHRWCLEQADRMIVSTPALERAYRRAFGGPIHVCRNSVDPSDWPTEMPERGEEFVVGYAGSASHFRDVKLIREALDWAARQPGVRTMTLGIKVGQHPQVPWTNTLADYRKSLEQFDVGLCPLFENAWSVCKSDVKALEYAMAGALPIVSEVEPYEPWKRHGFTAQQASGFTRWVKWAVRNQDEVRELARAAREYVLAERTIQQNVWRWEEACTTP